MPKSRAPRTSTSPPEHRGRVDRAIRDGKFQTGLDLAKQLVRAEPTPENRGRLVTCYLGRARQLLDMGSARDALVCLDVGLPHAGDDSESLVRFAEEFARCGEVGRALDLLQRVAEPRPANCVLALAADAAMQRGARHLLPESLRPEFDRVRAAFVDLQAGADDAVRAAIQGIGLTSPFLEWKVLLRGLLAFYQHDDARAIENWSRLDPTRLPSRLAAPLRLTIDRNLAHAQAPETQSLLRRQADRLVNDAALAGLRRMQSSLVKAQGSLAHVFREAEAVVPLLKQRDLNLVARLGRVLYWELIDQGRPEDTARYQRAFGKPSDDPDFARLRALAMEHEDGTLSESHQEWQRYEKSLAALPALTESQRRRARAMVWMRMANNARRHDGRIADRLPLFRFESVDLPQRLSPPAVTCLRRAIELAPDWLDPRVALVDTLQHAGQVAEAVTAAEALVQRFPDHLPTLELLAHLHRDAGDLDKAALMYERALAVNPLNRVLGLELERTRRRLGTRLTAQGRYAEARAAFEAARSRAPESPHPLVDASWAACEFKAGNAQRGEDLLRRAESPEGRIFLDGWMYAHAIHLKLPKAVKERFEKRFKAILDAEQPTPEQVAPLVALFTLFEQEQFDYHGAKTHCKKVIAQAEKTASQPYRDELMQGVGMGLLRLEASRVLRKLATKWAREFPESPWPPCFLMESYLTANEERWPLWRLNPLAERAKALAKKMPPGSARDNLLHMIGQRLEQFRELNPFAEMFEQLGDGAWEEDNPW